MRTFKSTAIAVSLVLTTLISTQTVSAAPTDVFPKGPYKATLIAEQILYPSLLGVAAGLPVADASGVLLADGKLRAYVFAQNKGIEVWDSSDGISFTRAGNSNSALRTKNDSIAASPSGVMSAAIRPIGSVPPSGCGKSVENA